MNRSHVVRGHKSFHTDALRYKENGRKNFLKFSVSKSRYPYIMNSHHVSGYDITANEVPTAEICPSSYIYYVIENRNDQEIENPKNINLNEFVDPNAKILIDKYLRDLFAKKQRGKPYLRNNNTRKQTSANEFPVNGCISKNMVHKSVQTDRLINVCTHKITTNKHSMENYNIRNTIGAKCNKEIISVNSKNCKNNNYHGNDRLLIQSQSAKSLSGLSSNVISDVEESRKKLHVTKIGFGNKSNNISSAYSKGYSNSNMLNSNDMRYINIKCSTKLQQIPINVQTLNGRSSSTHIRQNANAQNCSTIANTTNSFTYSSFNRNGNNLITKAHSAYASPSTSTKKIQLQELKTYSRKASDSNNSCYLLNTIPSTQLEHKYFMAQTSTVDKYHKLKTNSNCITPKKINANTGDVYSIISTCSPPKVSETSLNGKFPNVPANNIVPVAENGTNDLVDAHIANVASTRSTNIGDSMSIKLVTSHNTTGSDLKHELQSNHSVLFANKQSPTNYADYNSILQTSGGGL